MSIGDEFVKFWFKNEFDVISYREVQKLKDQHVLEHRRGRHVKKSTTCGGSGCHINHGK